MASDSDGDGRIDELRERVAELESKVPDGPTRRQVVAGGGLLGLGGLLGGGASQQVSAQSAAGQVGTESSPIDIYAWDLDVSSSITDAAGVEHTGELADAADVSSGGAFTDDDSDNIYTLPNASDGIAVGVITGNIAPNGGITNVSGNQFVADSVSNAPSPKHAGDILLVPASDSGGSSLPSSVQSQWKLEETSSPAVDSVGSNDASWQGSITGGVATARGDGYSFEGGYLDVGTGVYDYAEGTVVAWIELDNLDSRHTIFGQDTAGNNVGDFRFLVDDGSDPNADKGDLVLLQQDGSESRPVSTATSMSAGTRYKVAATFGDGVTLYIDDVDETSSETSSSHSIGITNTNAPTNIGAYDNGSGNFLGDMGEVLIADSILTQSEIEGL